MYCIFSTLPLDVENAVIHTLDSEGVGFWQIYSFIFSKIYIMRKVKIFFESIMENDSVEEIYFYRSVLLWNRLLWKKGYRRILYQG